MSTTGETTPGETTTGETRPGRRRRPDGVVGEDDVFGALAGVVDPELGAAITDLGMVRSVEIDGGNVTVGIALTVASCPMRSVIESDATRRIGALPGVTGVTVETTAMTSEQRSALMSVARQKARENANPTRIAPTTRVVAVASGKGGVGKSSVSVNLALAIADQGHRVGLLDADIWGFSIPRMLGLTGRLAADDDSRLIIPAESHGIEVVSTGLILDDEETALMWRGLMLSKALGQFLDQVDWSDVDYLIIDMPPGTGDIQMALSRLLPQAEMIVVTTPQKAAQKVAIRVADMARRSHMPVIGVVENMADFTCSHGDTYALFGSGGGDELAESTGAPLIGRIPLDPAVVRGGDDGNPIVRADPANPAARAFADLADTLTRLLPPAADETCTGRIAKLLDGLDATRGHLPVGG